MSEIVDIRYLEDDKTERMVAALAHDKLIGMGRLCIMSPIYFDENGADALTPIIESGDMYIQGVGAVVDTFDLAIASES